MNTTRSSKRLGAIPVMMAMAMLLGACAHTPSPLESSPTPGEPPRLSGSAVIDSGIMNPIPVALNPDIPGTYTVAPGDTLWSIAQRYLQNPWQWREIWRQNPQISNPNRIYPGDTLRFSYDPSGRPQLEIAAREEIPLLKLSPEIRIEELTQPIPPVPRDAVEAFLTRALILDASHWKSMPYIAADEEGRLLVADRDRVYARGGLFDQPRYQVFRPGEDLREPGSGRYLGTTGLYLGEAVLEKDGDPATFRLANTISPVRPGDRLSEFEMERELYSFEPHPVPPDTDGFIIAKLDTDVTQITQYSSVILNLGAQEGLEPGHVLAVHGEGRTVRDPISGSRLRLPGEQSGLLMVYKVHDLVSYALVMQAERPIRLQDRVTTP